MSRRRRVRIPELTTAINEILEEYGGNVTEGVKAAVLKVAEIAKQETKAGSPYGYGRKGRHYANQWYVKEDVVDRFRTDAIVHNRTKYQLTHLLEKGHALKKGGRTIGQVRPLVHIAPAEEHVVKNFEEAVKKVAQEG